MRRQKSFNPFYLFLVVAGIAFCVTACAFGVMTLRQMRSSQPLAGDESGRPHPLLVLMERRGMELMLWELGVLAVCTFAAIGTDQFWNKEGDAASPKTLPDSTKPAAATAPSVAKTDIHEPVSQPLSGADTA